MQRVLQILTDFILTKILGSRCYYNPHFINKETEEGVMLVICPGSS